MSAPDLCIETTGNVMTITHIPSAIKISAPIKASAKITQRELLKELDRRLNNGQQKNNVSV